MRPADPADFEAIDWSQPWLSPWRTRGEPLAALAGRVGTIEALNAAVAGSIALRAGPLRFVAHADLPVGEAYESFIDRTACVPTRVNLHDFLNGLAWLVYPAMKQRLNELQACELAKDASRTSRGAVRDALTLFDENGAWLRAPPVLLDALRRRDWRALFTLHRQAWDEARFEVFGHALIEKLMRPRKAITAHVWVAPVDATSAMQMFTDLLTPQRLADKPFLPLPVLGVPGWWPPNESPEFYGDASVFRPPQKQTATRGSLS